MAYEHLSHRYIFKAVFCVHESHFMELKYDSKKPNLLSAISCVNGT